MLKLFNRKKKDNKGFTLVELVIVIAILAILVGLLAPQYTKYVERSRKAADASNMDEMVKVVKVFAADPANDLEVGKYVITIQAAKTGSTVITKGGTDISTAATALKTEMDLAIPKWDKTVTKSKKWGKAGDAKNIIATIDVNKEGGTSVAYTTEDDDKGGNKFESYMISNNAGDGNATK